MHKPGSGRYRFVWDNEVYEKVKLSAKLGLNYKQIAQSIGCCYETFRVKRNQKTGKHSALSAAIAEGRMEGQAAVARVVLKQALDGSLDASKYYLDKTAWCDRREEREECDDKKEESVLTIIHKMEETKSEETTD